MSCTFYAKTDGGLADAGGKFDMLSPTTQAWLYFMMSNPGACYPAILAEFQYGALNRCDNKVNTLRQIVFVKPHVKTWTSKEIITGLALKFEQNFSTTAKHMKDFCTETFSRIGKED